MGRRRQKSEKLFSHNSNRKVDDITHRHLSMRRILDQTVEVFDLPYFKCPHCENLFFVEPEIKLKVDRGGYLLKQGNDEILKDKCKDRDKHGNRK